MAPTSFETHDVYNQPPPMPVRNLFETDPILYGALEPALDEEGERILSAHGAFWGTVEARELARLANVNPPLLRTHDGQGRRIDLVEYHPAYHAMMRRSAEAGLGISILDGDTPEDSGRAHAMRTAKLILTAQTENGHLLPWSTTCAAAGLVETTAELGETWLSGLLSRRYDHRQMPPAFKAGLTLGLGMTEKQGGVAAVDTTSKATRVDGRRYRLVGHKWFVSAPTSDGLVVLAEAPGGPSAFLVPRFRIDETLNRVHLQRLKQSVGTRANAIGEIEFADAEAALIGQEGEGPRLFAYALQTLQHDAAAIATGVMRGALTHAVQHVRHRSVAGARLLDQPLMARVLADAAIDVAGATALVVRIAMARDRAAHDPVEDAIAKLLTPAAKYWIGRLAPAVAAEALECLGGNGYVEDAEAARLFRDAPAYAVWAGPGNQAALEVLGLIETAPEALDAVLTGLSGDLTGDAAASADAIRGAAGACVKDPGSARILVEQLAVTAASASLARFAPRAISEAFVQTRLVGGWRAGFGMLDGRFDAKGIVDYAYPGI